VGQARIVLAQFGLIDDINGARATYTGRSTPGARARYLPTSLRSNPTYFAR